MLRIFFQKNKIKEYGMVFSQVEFSRNQMLKICLIINNNKKAKEYFFVQTTAREHQKKKTKAIHIFRAFNH